VPATEKTDKPQEIANPPSSNTLPGRMPAKPDTGRKHVFRKQQRQQHLHEAGMPQIVRISAGLIALLAADDWPLLCAGPSAPAERLRSPKKKKKRAAAGYTSLPLTHNSFSP
jgi:hypothetical protein